MMMTANAPETDSSFGQRAAKAETWRACGRIEAAASIHHPDGDATAVGHKRQPALLGSGVRSHIVECLTGGVGQRGRCGGRKIGGFQAALPVHLEPEQLGGGHHLAQAGT